MIDNTALDRLIEAGTPRDQFGPHTDNPCLILDLSNTDEEHSNWLHDLPCPVIGVGDGELKKVCDVTLKNDRGLDRIINNINHAPVAAMILVQHLRASESLGLEDKLSAESFAYATVQNGPEFGDWLVDSKQSKIPVVTKTPLKMSVERGEMELTFNDPDNENAIGVAMRDALCEALDLALIDKSISAISLTGAGRVFSTGGEVAEFGEVSDPATAHWIRSLRLPAWRLARLKERFQVHVNGAAIGAGAEIAAFGHLVTATENAWFQLPELKYGLIPGAGGTASLPRRIGRQRTAYMALSMKKINAHTALEWGLVDEIVS